MAFAGTDFGRIREQGFQPLYLPLWIGELGRVANPVRVAGVAHPREGQRHRFKGLAFLLPRDTCLLYPDSSFNLEPTRQFRNARS